MITLYTYLTGNGFRAAIGLEEAALEWKPVFVELREGRQRSSEFRALNPAGQIPVIEDPDGPNGPIVLTQTPAILLYAARKSGALLPSDETERWRTLERLSLVTHDVVGPYNSGFVLGNAGKMRPAVRVLEQRTLDRLELLESFLSDAPFLAGDMFTLVDCAAFPLLRILNEKGRLEGYPRLCDWTMRLASRPSIVAALTKASAVQAGEVF